MELRRLGDALLRSQASPLNFLTPSIPSSCRYLGQRSLKSYRKAQLRRYSVTTAYHAPRTPHNMTSTRTPADESLTDKTSSQSSETSWTGSVRHSSPASEMLLNKGNSASDLLNSINALRSSRLGNSSSSSSAFDINLMTTPGRNGAGTNSSPLRFEVNELMNDITRGIHQPPPARVPMRLTPSTGRTVAIGGNVDVGRGFRLLEQSCGRNRVRSDFTSQRFHERPGLKRKRLKSSRWRRRFMEGFKATVRRVKQMKAQGW